MNQRNGRIIAGAIVAVLIAFSALWVACGGALTSLPEQLATQPEASQSVDDRERSELHRALEQAAAELLDRMKGQDAAFVSSLASALDEGFYQTTGYHHADLGVDPRSVAQWLLDGFDYTVQDITLGDAEGAVEVSIVHRDGSELLSAFYDRAYEFFASSEAEGLDETAARARMGQLYQEAMNATTTTAQTDARLDFALEDGAWRVDDTDYETLLSRLFDVYGEESGGANAPGNEQGRDSAESRPSSPLSESSPSASNGNDGTAGALSADDAQEDALSSGSGR